MGCRPFSWTGTKCDVHKTCASATPEMHCIAQTVGPFELKIGGHKGGFINYRGGREQF